MSLAVTDMKCMSGSETMIIERGVKYTPIGFGIANPTGHENVFEQRARAR